MILKECDIQIQIVEYLRLIKGIIFFSVPNESFAPKKGKLTGAQLGRMSRMKRMGLKAGVSDLVICKVGKVFFLEVKTEKGKLSENQKSFREEAVFSRCPYAIVRSLEGAIEQFREWGIK